MLKYIQHGGKQMPRTRTLASKFGHMAVDLFHKGNGKQLVGITKGKEFVSALYQ
jgi:6-phosphofructokinase